MPATTFDTSVQCEHCGALHDNVERICPKTGKLFRPERIFPPGTMLGGKYRLGRVLGSGGMGAVFEAQHTLLQKRVAIKLMLPEMAEDHELLARMVREARTASATGHRNIVMVTDMGWEKGAPYLVMEFLEGQTVRQLIHTRTRIPLDEAVDLIDQVLSALEVVHARGIVHRDLKPDNIMVVHDEEGRPQAKLVDFGISKVLGAGRQQDLTQTGHLLGSPRYMSPEQARGDKAIDHRSDIYSTAAVLYQMISGRPTHEAKTFSTMIAAILRRDVPPPSSKCAELGPDVDRVLLQALERVPARRFADARSFRDALAALVKAPGAGAVHGSAVFDQDEGGAFASLAAGLPELDVTDKDLEEPAFGSIGSSAPRVDSKETTTRAVPAASGREKSDLKRSRGPFERSTEAAMAAVGRTDSRPETGHRGDPVPQMGLDASELVTVEHERKRGGRVANAARPTQRERGDPRSAADRGDVSASLQLDRGGYWQGQQSHAPRPESSLGGGAARAPNLRSEGGRSGPEPTLHAGAYLHSGETSGSSLLAKARVVAVIALLCVLGAIGWSQRRQIMDWLGIVPDTTDGDSVLVVVRCRPAQAKIYLDGVYQVSSSIRLPREDRSYHLRVTADGYSSEERQISALATQVVEVRLKKGAIELATVQPHVNGYDGYLNRTLGAC